MALTVNCPDCGLKLSTKGYKNHMKFKHGTILGRQEAKLTQPRKVGRPPKVAVPNPDIEPLLRIADMMASMLITQVPVNPASLAVAGEYLKGRANLLR